MTVLSLLLAAPLQAWGTSSRFTSRFTDPQPSKSGIIGMLAAAQGLRRTDPLEDLLTLRFAVRVEQPGDVVRDFQTARSLDGKDTMPLSYRYYRSDARYVVGVEGDRELLDGLAESLRRPVFPLYLGRRSCPPSEPIIPRLDHETLEEMLVEEPWNPSEWYRRRMRGRPEVLLSFTIDEAPGYGGQLRAPLVDLARGIGSTTTRDEPISFDPRRRQYGWRPVVSGLLVAPGTSKAVVEEEPESDDSPDFMGVFT